MIDKVRVIINTHFVKLFNKCVALFTHKFTSKPKLKRKELDGNEKNYHDCAYTFFHMKNTEFGHSWLYPPEEFGPQCIPFPPAGWWGWESRS